MIARLRNYLAQHAQNFVGACKILIRQPVASVLTILVIAIALALPAALNIAIQNGRSLAGGWDGARDFSVYLKPGASIKAAQQLKQEFDDSVIIDSVELISADDALSGFSSDTNFGDLVSAFETNPLPHTLVLRPLTDATPEQLQSVKIRLSGNALVDLIKLDTDWVMRLNAFIDLTRRAVWLATALLVIAVIVIVGNTIRLDIQNRRAEIEVSKLLGANDGFVRRPFLYTGFWYGLSGSLGALVLLLIALAVLRGPVYRLIDLYGGSFSPLGLDWLTVAAIFGCGLLAGLGGAWIAVARHLAAIQPKV